MGWDAQPDPTSAPAPQAARVPQQPGALTMGWDAQPEPAPAAAQVSPAALASRSVATSNTPMQPAQAGKPKAAPAATLFGVQAPKVGQPVAQVAQVAQRVPSAEPSPTVHVEPSYMQAQPQAQYAPPPQPAQMPAGAPYAQAQAQAPYAPLPSSAPPEPQMPASAPPYQASNPPHAAPIPAHDPPRQVPSAAPQQTSAAPSEADDQLDKPPRNLLPIYAAIALLVLAGAGIGAFLALR
jgi:hypothetical protein